MTVIDKIKKLLFTYDNCILVAEGYIRKTEIEMERYQHYRKGTYAKKYLTAKIENERYQIYMSEIIKARQEVIGGFSTIAERYIGEYKDIFYQHYFEGRDFTQIANKQKCSVEAVKRVIDRIERDLLLFYDNNCSQNDNF